MAGEKDAGDVKLLGAWPSPFVMRARIALNLKGVEYELLEENPYDKSERLAKLNPVHKKIPVLLHADRTICESLVIVQYIDEVWTSAATILPTDPYDQAVARFWATYIDDKWYPSMMGIAKAQTDEARAAAMGELFAGLQVLEEAFGKCSKGKAFFGGDTVGYVDIALGCFLGFIRVTERLSGVKILDEARTPGLALWAERFCADEAVKGVMPETDRLVEFSKSLQAMWKAKAAAAAAAAGAFVS